MKENGRMIKSMEKELKFIQMEECILENFKMERDKERANLNGYICLKNQLYLFLKISLMAKYMMENGKLDKSMDLDYGEDLRVRI